MLMMNSTALPSMPWKIRSVSVRSRDGSHRLMEVYRILLKQRDGTRLACHAGQGAVRTTEERKGNHARRHRRSSVN